MRLNWFNRLIYKLRGRDPMAEYLAWLIQFGRIAEGRILDFNHDDSMTTIFFRYNVANVDYETSQKLTPEQIKRAHQYIPGASVSVRYDPKNPGSSLVT